MSQLDPSPNNPPPSQLLRQISQEMRSIEDSTEKYFSEEPFPASAERFLDTGGWLLDRARQLGAFAGPEYVALNRELDRQKELRPNKWRELTFSVALYWFLPEVGVDTRKGDVEYEYKVCFDSMADLIEREATRLEQGSGTPTAKKDQAEAEAESPKRPGTVSGAEAADSSEAPQFTPQGEREPNIEKVIEGSEEDIAVQDGPGDRVGEFWWGGKRTEDFSAQEWKLLVALWNAPDRQLCYADIGGEVWGNECVNENTLKSAVSRLQASLVDRQLPLTARTSHETVILEKVA